MSERKMVRTLVDPYSQDYEFCDLSFDELVEKMLRLKEQYKGRNVQYVRETVDYNDRPGLYLVEYREETDDEQEARLAQERREKECREQHERAELERLKKKFE